MRTLIAIVLAFALAACASTAPQPTASATGVSGSYGAATLSWSPLEDQLAPAYTRVTMAARRTEAALRAGRITVAQAQTARDRLREALATLAESRATRDTALIQRAHALIDEAEQ